MHWVTTQQTFISRKLMLFMGGKAVEKGGKTDIVQKAVA
jgi:hypothetical protein